MKSIRELVEEEKLHYLKCTCGEYYDMRDLVQVFEHLHSNNVPKAEYSHSMKVGEPVVYKSDRQEIIIN